MNLKTILYGVSLGSVIGGVIGEASMIVGMLLGQVDLNIGGIAGTLFAILFSIGLCYLTYPIPE